nr:hypothetical protein [Bacillota bacterium]
VIIADTTPFVLVLPATFDSLFHSPEDSYDRWFPVNLLRWVRFLAAALSLTIPGLYVALVAYHPGILPTEFTLRLMTSREGVAFPVLVEALLMQFFLELIKEAGFRMPSPIGQTFGIVGGLILGDMGVRAGLVSEAMVIIVAITAVDSGCGVAAQGPSQHADDDAAPGNARLGSQCVLGPRFHLPGAARP